MLKFSKTGTYIHRIEQQIETPVMRTCKLQIITVEDLRQTDVAYNNIKANRAIKQSENKINSDK